MECDCIDSNKRRFTFYITQGIFNCKPLKLIVKSSIKTNAIYYMKGRIVSASGDGSLKVMKITYKVITNNKLIANVKYRFGICRWGDV